MFLAYGTVFLAVVDLPQLPFKGQTGNATLAFNRFYSSADPYTGPLGTGWTHNYNILLTNNTSSVTIKRWDGRVITFTASGGNYLSPAGESSRLTQPGSSNFVWQLQHGTRYIFSTATGNPLAKIQDRQGNYVTLSYSSGGLLTNVTDSASTGRQLTLKYDANNNLQQITDPLSRSVYYTNSNGHLTGVADSIGTRAVYYYDDATNPNAITRTVDANNKTTGYGYDSSGAVIRQTNALQNATQTFTYDWANRGVTVTNYLGNWAYTITNNASGQQTAYVNPLGTNQYNLDGTTGLLTNYVDLMGYSRTNLWNTNLSALTAHINALGNTNLWLYETNFAFVTSFTNAMGQVFQWAYDGSGNLTNYLDNKNHQTQFQYDVSGNLTYIIDANAHTNRMVYSTYGDMTWFIDGLGNHFHFNYDAVGRLTTNYNDLYQTNTFAWDDRDRLTQWIDPAGKTNSFALDGNGNCTSWTNALGKVTSYAYDAQNRPTSVTLPGAGGTFFSYGYDNANNLTRVTNGLGNPFGLGYDAENRLTSVTNELSKVWNLTLNANGWRTQLVDPNTHTNQYSYDKAAELTYWTNGLQQVVQYQYDAARRLTNIVDGRNNSLGFGYDPCCNAQLTQISYASGDAQNFGYDAVGNLAYFTNRISQVVTNGYDAANELTQKVYVSASDVITYAYDAAHQLTNIVWTQGASTTNTALSVAYDVTGRVTNETSVVGSAAALTVSYQYYDDGRRKQLTYPDSTNVTYDYYDNGFLKDIKDGGGNAIVTYYYDAAGHCTNKTLLNSTYTVYAYDAAGHLAGLTNYYGNGSVICGYTYGYDNAGNRTYVKRSTGLGDVYTYDAADQLTKVTYQATNPDGSPGAGTNQVVYVIDAAGNWSSVTNIIPSTSTNSTTYQVNNLNQYTNIGNQTYYYTNGNYWKNSSNSFFYDYESRLICSYVGGITITNTYDGLGRHVGRKHSAIWTRYYYAGWQLIEERDRTGNVTADYVYGIGLDEPIRMARNGTNYYYHTDGLGSITAVTDGNGTLIEQYSYDVYGTPTIYDGNTNVISASAISNPWLFQGRYWETDALLYNYRFRYYHPGMGRFVQVDPMLSPFGSCGRNGSAVNLYTYVGNAPTVWGDPLGLTFRSNLAFLLDFLTGHGPRQRNCGPGSLESNEMRDSPAAKALRKQFYGNPNALLPFNNGGYGTFEAFWDTLINPFTADWSSTAVQVGGFAGATATPNLADGTVTFSIQNTAGTDSFFYHMLGSNKSGTTGPMSTIKQTIWWTEPMAIVNVPVVNIPYNTGKRNAPLPTLAH